MAISVNVCSRILLITLSIMLCFIHLFLIFVQKHNLAFEIVKTTFQMEQMIKQAPGSSLHNMTDVEYHRYTDLLKKKSAMSAEVHALMINDGDL